jgi:hypothetical protein
MEYRKWSTEEKTYLQNNYVALGGRECAKALGRGFHQTRAMAQFLKIKGRQARRTELAKMKNNYLHKAGQPYCGTLTDDGKLRVQIDRKTFVYLRPNLGAEQRERVVSLLYDHIQKQRVTLS